MTSCYEVVIVGGGLAGGLLALALTRVGRGADVVVVESGHTWAGSHTWSFHESDLSEAEHELVRPLVSARWAGHRVAFPAHARELAGGYASITSAQFAAVLAPRLEAAGVRTLLGRRAVALGSGPGRSTVVLDDGTVLDGSLVIDARGPLAGADLTRHGDHGAQKFVGLEVELADDGPWTVPVLMDATVAQIDGFRFVYVLPFTRRRVLVEDTIYTGDARLDTGAGRARVLAYLAAHGARVRSIVREEAGVLPLPLRDGGGGGDGAPEVHAGGARPPGAGRRGAEAAAHAPAPILAIGYRGGFFHPVTGYSLPLAARVALAIADAARAVDARAAVLRLRAELRPQWRFGLLLNRLMFRAMEPAGRWTALARFYRLPEPVIARFYASRSTWLDRARVLVGRPPAGIAWKRLWPAGRGSSQSQSQSHPQEEASA